jgi:hypothetical protein
MSVARSKAEAEAPEICRYYKRVPHAAATRCWGVILCVGLALPVIAQQTTTTGQTVPPPTTTPPATTGAQTPPATAPTPTPQATPAAPAAPAAPAYAFKWRQALGDQGPIAIVANDALIITVGGTPPVAARSMEDGELVWQQSTVATARPATGDHLVFVPSTERLVALDEKTGAIVWQDDLAATSPPVWRAGWLVAAGDRELRAYRATDGTKLWAKPLPARMQNAPVIDGDRVFMTLADRTLNAVDIKTGAIEWTVPLDNEPGPLLAANGFVYFGADERLFAYPQERALRASWGFPGRSAVIGTPVADANHVYVTLLDNTVRALDARSGTMRWQHAVAARAAPGLLIGADVLAVPLASGDIAICTPRVGAPYGTVTFVPPPDAPPGFFSRVESSAATTDLKRIFLATVGFEDHRTLTAFERAAPAAKK